MSREDLPFRWVKELGLSVTLSVLLVGALVWQTREQMAELRATRQETTQLVKDTTTALGRVSETMERIARAEEEHARVASLAAGAGRR